MSKRILVVEDQRIIARSFAICLLAPITKSPRPKTVRRRSKQSPSSGRSHPDGYPIANHGRLYRHAPHQS